MLITITDELFETELESTEQAIELLNKVEEIIDSIIDVGKYDEESKLDIKLKEVSELLYTAQFKLQDSVDIQSLVV